MRKRLFRLQNAYNKGTGKHNLIQRGVLSNFAVEELVDPQSYRDNHEEQR
jgi:hypothetical protein